MIHAVLEALSGSQVIYSDLNDVTAYGVLTEVGEPENGYIAITLEEPHISFNVQVCIADARIEVKEKQTIIHG